jgi:hypothetical protein
MREMKSHPYECIAKFVVKNTLFDVFSARQELNGILSFTDIRGFSFILRRSINVFGSPEIISSTYSTYKVARLLETFSFAIE